MGHIAGKKLGINWDKVWNKIEGGWALFETGMGKNWEGVGNELRLG